ncbi:P-loop NTPase fold protein [Anaerosalibacter bizertensis]|uniref:P-loop NTPase fold protein n=1 Tax=Anaerosalibacter bizertensis TaxID=932217 RepID=UPI0035191B5E
MKKPILIGITGGTGSGKSTVAKEIYSSIKETNVTIIQQDSYYRDQSNLTFEERKKTNYDHPFAFDNELLIEHLNKLLEGLPVEKPIYDFEKHNRKKETITVWPREIIILEGLLILNDERIRELLDEEIA